MHNCTRNMHILALMVAVGANLCRHLECNLAQEGSRYVKSALSSAGFRFHTALAYAVYGETKSKKTVRRLPCIALSKCNY